MLTFLCSLRPDPLPLGDWEPVPWGSLSLKMEPVRKRGCSWVVLGRWVVGLAPGAAWAVGAPRVGAALAGKLGVE